MIGIQEFTCSQMKLEQFLNTDAVRLGWKILSIQKITYWYWFSFDISNWVVAYEKENKSC